MSSLGPAGFSMFVCVRRFMLDFWPLGFHGYFNIVGENETRHRDFLTQTLRVSCLTHWVGWLVGWLFLSPSSGCETYTHSQSRKTHYLIKHVFYFYPVGETGNSHTIIKQDTSKKSTVAVWPTIPVYILVICFRNPCYTETCTVSFDSQKIEVGKILTRGCIYLTTAPIYLSNTGYIHVKGNVRCFYIFITGW